MLCDNFDEDRSRRMIATDVYTVTFSEKKSCNRFANQSKKLFPSASQHYVKATDTKAVNNVLFLFIENLVYRLTKI